MKHKYIIPEGTYEVKRPDVPKEQTAQKGEMQEVLEILLDGEKPKGIGRRKPTLSDKAREFRKHINEMEAGYERDTTHAED